MELKKFNGLIAAPFAPMDQNGDLNLGIIPEYYDLLRHNQVGGVFINGSTGEGASLTCGEKKDVVEAWADAGSGDGDIRIINLVGGTSLRECIDLAIYSAEKGIDAVAVMAPYYFKPSSLALLGEFIGAVASSVPGMPVYYYHIPVLTGVNFPMIRLLEYVDGRIPNFAGIKYTYDDLMDFCRCLEYGQKKYNILWGRDEILLSALALGAEGAVGSTYNYAAPLYQSIITSFSEGNNGQARLLQLKSMEMVSLLAKYGGIGAGKSFMKYIGIDCGDFRLPVRSLNEEEHNRFLDDVKALDMTGLFSRKPSKQLI